MSVISEWLRLRPSSSRAMSLQRSATSEPNEMGADAIYGEHSNDGRVRITVYQESIAQWTGIELTPEGGVIVVGRSVKQEDVYEMFDD